MPISLHSKWKSCSKPLPSKILNCFFDLPTRHGFSSACGILQDGSNVVGKSGSYYDPNPNTNFRSQPTNYLGRLANEDFLRLLLILCSYWLNPLFRLATEESFHQLQDLFSTVLPTNRRVIMTGQMKEVLAKPWKQNQALGKSVRDVARTYGRFHRSELYQNTTGSRMTYMLYEALH